MRLAVALFVVSMILSLLATVLFWVAVWYRDPSTLLWSLAAGANGVCAYVLAHVAMRRSDRPTP